MNLDNLNKWLTLLANIGMLIGIFFVGVEINQGTRATRAQTVQGIWDQVTAFNVMIGDSQANRDVFLRFMASGYENLEDNEIGTANRMFRQNLEIYDNAYYQYQQGSLDDDAFSRFRRVIDRRVEVPAFKEFWEISSFMFTDSFQIYINSLLERSDSGT